MAKKLDNPIPTRRSLLIRLKNWQDEESWNDFCQIYRGLIFGVAKREGLTDGEAEDVVQETFISIARKIQDFRYDPAIGSFKNWLLHTTNWRIRDQFRKRRKAPLTPDRTTRTSGGTSTTDRIPDPAGFRLEEAWEKEWEKNLFDSALKKVKPKVRAEQYQLFDLYVIKEWPVQRIAKTFSVSVGRVYLAKHRVAILLKKEIKVLRRKMACT